MSETSMSGLRDHAGVLLDRVAAGESITITSNGRPVAKLVPIERQTRWMGRDRFADLILSRQADAAMADDLALLDGETTDDLPL